VPPGRTHLYPNSSTTGIELSFALSIILAISVKRGSFHDTAPASCVTPWGEDVGCFYAVFTGEGVC